MSIDQRIRDGLQATNDQLSAPDIDRALAAVTAGGRPAHRRNLVLALGAAAVVVLIVGALAVTRAAHYSKEPIGPLAPTPTGIRDPKALGTAIYFDATAVEGDSLSGARALAGPKDIYLTREGGTAQQIIATRAPEYCPMVSPEGDMLAYLEGTTVVVRRLDASGLPGATTARVQHSPSADGLACPQWSPDGRRLAVATYGPDGSLEVRVIELDGTERTLSTHGGQGMFAWSPDGQAIAYTTFDSVWVAPLDGGEARRLWQGRTSGRSGVGPWPGHPTKLAWLATGELAVSAQTDVDGHYAQHIVDAVSGHDQVIGTVLIGGSGWSWSPDGSRLAFADTDGTEQLLDRVSGTTVPIRPRLSGHVLPIGKLVWSPDGRRLVGTAADPDPSTGGFRYGLVSMDPGGGSVKVLTPWTLALYSEADASWSAR
jgi:Tol biopolymer transport system component